MSHRIYTPKNFDQERGSLLVMLHGCAQTPEDFAAGTRMNQHADRHGFLVLYPAQSPVANPMGCWNWFNETDQQRDHGEPSLIVDLTRRIATQHGLEGKQIYVAGLSAGGAMAVILGVTYPDVFAAVGVHSGLPYGAAHDASSAFAVMRGTASTRMTPEVFAAPPLPTIAFHGDDDVTVAESNGSALVDQTVALAARDLGPLAKTVETQEPARGRSYTTTRYTPEETGDASRIEYWVVHGAGHAWSGGAPDVSFMDPSGPDASAEMVRFFMSQSES